MEIYITENPLHTQRLGEEFTRRLILDQGSTLTTARVIALYGELGSGKTTFVQGLAKGLGVKQRIISPTFIIIRTYKLKSQNSNRKTTTQNSKLFYHIDLYRIVNDIKGLGLEEILENPQNVVAIEWAERLGDLLPKERWDLYFKYLDEEKRKIIWKSK